MSPVNGGSRRVALRAFAREATRFSFLIGLMGMSQLALAYPGEQLLAFGSNYIIAPLGIFAVVLALAGSFFRPDLVRSAIYAAIICAVLFFVVKMAPQLMTSMKS